MSKRQELVEFKCYYFFFQGYDVIFNKFKTTIQGDFSKVLGLFFFFFFFFFFFSGKHHIQFFALNFLLQRRAKVNMATVVLASMKDVIFLSFCFISGTCLLLLAKTSKLLKLLDNMDGSRS